MRRLKNPWRSGGLGILGRTALLSWLVTIITLIVFIAVIVPSQRAAFLQNLESKAHGMSVSLHDVAAGAAISEDYGAVVEHCTRFIAEDPSIEYLILTRRDGFSLTHNREGWRTETLTGEWNPPERTARGGIQNDEIADGKVFRHSRPFDYSGIEWGWIHVGLSLQSFEASTRRFYRVLGLAFVLCMAVGFLVSIVYARRISQPVVKLRKAVQAVSGGDLSIRADVTSQDEVGELASSFNQMTESLVQRDAILQSVWFAAQEFLASDDWREVIDDVLSNLGSAADVSRVYVFGNHFDENGSRLTSQLHEWAAPDTPSELENPDLQNVQLEEAGFSRWVSYLNVGHPLVGDISSFPDSERSLLEPQNIVSIALVPIRVAGTWWGFIGLDECRRSRTWSEPVIVSLRAAAETLGAAIERQWAQEALILAKERAEAGSRAKSQFLANLSHEIRTPITGVIGMLQLLDRATVEGKQRRYVTNALNSAETLLTVIGDVLDYSKIEAGRLELKKAPFSLTDTLDSTIRIFAEAAERKGIELGYSVEGTLPHEVTGDADRLRQILMNLIGNAIKFTEEGQVFVHYALASETEQDVVIQCEVRDTGCGIAPEQQEEIFEAFSQADNSMSRTHGGSGLGLAISKQLCNLIGGSIELVSEPSQGSTFRFTAQFTKSANTSKPSLIRDLKGLRVLVVDDCPATRQTLCEYVESWKGTVVEAPDAVIGLEKLVDAAEKNEPFVLAVLDWKLPGLDGLGLAEIVRKNPALNSTSLVLLSGYTMSLSVSESAEDLFTASLLKPVRKSDLYNAIVAAANGSLSGATESEDISSTPEEPFQSDLRGRVLLVEDNEINREVAREILLGFGLSVITADNGIEALERVKLDRPDLVFMDCQMPVMDGYEATSLIREWEERGSSGTRLPIVALTAHAMKGDREVCLAAGMDDFLTKPIDLVELEDALRKWLPDSEQQAGPVVEEVQGPIDFEALRAQYAGKPDLIHRIVEMFRYQAPEDVEEIEAAVSTKDASRLEARAHRLKGSAAHLFAHPIRQLAAELEVHGRENTMESVADLVHRLRELIDQLERQVSHATDGQKPSDRACA